MTDFYNFDEYTKSKDEVKTNVVIYVDEMFLENFIMNYLIIYMTSYFSKLKVCWYKMAIGAGVGALYVIFSYILNITVYQNIICKFILALFIVSVSFYPRDVKEFVKSISIFYLITFVIGGASFSFAYLLNIKNSIYDGVLYIEEFPLQMLVISAFVVFILLKIITILLKNKIRFESIIFPIEICANNKKILIDAFLDTGNNVKEPYTNKEVIFAELESIKSLVPYNVYEVFKNCDEIKTISDNYWKTRFRLIPFSTVGYDNQIFMGFKPDRIIIYENERRIERDDVVIAVCERKLSKEGKYTALIGSGLITNDK